MRRAMSIFLLVMLRNDRLDRAARPCWVRRSQRACIDGSESISVLSDARSGLICCLPYDHTSAGIPLLRRAIHRANDTIDAITGDLRRALTRGPLSEREIVRGIDQRNM